MHGWMLHVRHHTYPPAGMVSTDPLVCAATVPSGAVRLKLTHTEAAVALAFMTAAEACTVPDGVPDRLYADGLAKSNAMHGHQYNERTSARQHRSAETTARFTETSTESG